MDRFLLALCLLISLAAFPLSTVAAPAPQVTIGYLPLTTTDESITIRGTAPRGEVVRLIVNDEIQARVVAMAKMDVFFIAVQLQPGANRIVAEHEPSGATATVNIYRTTVSFDDIKSHKLAVDVEILATLGIINGMGEGRFAPDEPVTRAQFAKLVVLGLGLTPEAGDLSFADGEAIADWARPYVATAVMQGLLKGYPDGTFQPSRPVTRLEVAVISSRGLKGKDKEKDKDKDKEKAYKPFGDQDRVPDWARADLEAAMEAGVVGDYLGPDLEPDRPATRGETAAAIRRLMEAHRGAKN